MFSLNGSVFSITRHVRWARKALAIVALIAAKPAAAAGQAAPTPENLTLDPARALVWLPMLGDKERQIVTLIQVNGQWLRAAIDTGLGGDDGLELSSATATRLGLSLRDGPWVRTYAGQLREQLATVAEFRFGALDVKSMPVEVVPSTRDVDATIGLAVLRQGTLQVDADGHRVRFLFPGELDRPGMAALSVPVTTNAKAQAQIPASLCGRPVTLVLDTGDENDLALNEATLRAASCRAAAGSDNRSTDGAGRRILEPITPLGSLAVGGVELGGVLATTLPVPAHPGEPPFNDTIGLGALHRSDFALDMASGRLALYGPVHSDQAGARPRVGVQVSAAGNHLLVTHLRRGSPAAASALREGDTICAIDGRTIADWNGHGGWTLNPPLEQPLTVATCDGRTVTITPVDFLAPPPGPVPTPTPTPPPFPAGLDRLTRAMNVCENGAGENKVTGCTVALNISTPGFFLRPLIMIFRGQAEEPLGDITAAIRDYHSALALGATAPWLTAHVADLTQRISSKATLH